MRDFGDDARNQRHAKAVQASAATLKLLAATDVGGEVPALTETLDAVRAMKIGKEKR